MPKTKEARQRYKIINNCLRNTMRKWQKKDLVEEINKQLAAFDMSIEERQFNYDINAMRHEYDAPIETRREGKQHFYYYEDPDFSIENQRVSKEDLRLLRDSVHLLQQIKGFSISQDIAAVVARLESRINTGQQAQDSIIGFENPPEMLGIENLSIIYQAIIRQNVLRIHYKPFKAPASRDRIIHPYYLKEYNNRWFLFGWNNELQVLDNLALDRFVTIVVEHIPYRPNTILDPAIFFSDMVGVTRDADSPVETLVIEVDADRAPYLETMPLHHSQTVLQRNQDGSICFSYQIIINRELVSQLLAYGEMLEVKEPAFLRELMLKRFWYAITKYYGITPSAV